MVYHGHIKAGRIELTEPTALPEGAAVRVEVVLLADVEKTADDSSLCKELSQLSGLVKGMPSDASQKHDHYIYGKPR